MADARDAAREEDSNEVQAGISSYEVIDPEPVEESRAQGLVEVWFSGSIEMLGRGVMGRDTAWFV